jgi:hypothetical protein
MQLVTGGVVTATSVPGDAPAAYAGLFGVYAATLGAAVLTYLLSRDARPEKPKPAGV